jgi:hypothetical protein
MRRTGRELLIWLHEITRAVDLAAEYFVLRVPFFFLPLHSINTTYIGTRPCSCITTIDNRAEGGTRWGGYNVLYCIDYGIVCCLHSVKVSARTHRAVPTTTGLNPEILNSIVINRSKSLNLEQGRFLLENSDSVSI